MLAIRFGMGTWLPVMKLCPCARVPAQKKTTNLSRVSIVAFSGDRSLIYFRDIIAKFLEI